MLDLAQLDRIRLTPRSWAQVALQRYFLAPQYELYPGVRVAFEGYDRVPSEPVIFAMNHTDFYTFFPFMYELVRVHERFASAWVKGKNYDNPAVARFMAATNQIPVPSRGYLLSRDFVNTIGRRPSEEEYATLRGYVERGEPLGDVPAALLTQPRDILGRRFNPTYESYADAMGALFAEMMRRFVGLNGRAFEAGLDLLVFPQGTRSIRLSRGHIGLAEVALHFGRTIVPVSANHVDRVYPGSSLFAKKGSVTYRFGAPITPAELAPYRPAEGFEPFNVADEARHRERFQALVDHVMDRVEEGLDERHRYNPGRQSDGLEGTRRFV